MDAIDKIMDGYLTRDSDRELFELKPREEKRAKKKMLTFKMYDNKII